MSHHLNWKNQAWIISLGLVLIVLSYLADDLIFPVIESLRSSYMDAVMIWMTQLKSLVFVMYIMTTVFALESKHGRKLIVPLWFSFLASYAASSLIKMIVMRRRPFGLESIFGIWDSSFPSGHVTISFAAAVVLQQLFPRIAWFWYLFAGLVGFSRLYINAHYLSDVMAGALLGYLIGLGTIYLASKNKLLKLPKQKPILDKLKFSWHGDYATEFRRKLLHMLVGISLVCLLHFELITIFQIFLLLSLGIGLSFLAKHYKIPVIQWFLDKFERKHTYPGKGAITFFVGAILALKLFPTDIALASILVLALGDGISTLIGPLGKIKHFLSETKLLEGTLAGIVLATVGASFFVPVHEAFLASTLAMGAEAAEIKFNNKLLSDNIFVPLVAGTAIVLFRSFVG